MITLRKSRAQGERAAKPQPEGQTQTLGAPVMGWIDTQTTGDGMVNPENVFPTQQGIRLRGGSARVANVGAPVVSMFSYTTAAISRLFAATEDGIFNVTSLDPEATLVADVSGQAAGYWIAAQLGTVGGDFLYAANGFDPVQLFDGSTWQAITDVSTPALTGTPTDALSYVWTHKNRFWFIQRNTRRAWYLPVDTVSGALSDFSLEGVFQKGGSLLFGATWSYDSGSGMDDRQVFVTSDGEVAVYEGSDPGSAADWALVGVYQMDPPLGPGAHIKAGGDLLIATGGGIVSLSAVIEKDPAALRASAVTARIENAWRERFQSYIATQPWELEKWPEEAMMVVSMPSTRNEMFVANLETGAWSRYTGWQATCTERFGQRLYFGSTDGYVYEAERGGSDAGAAYICQWAYQPNDFGQPSSFKTVAAVQGTFAGSRDAAPRLTVAVDYDKGFPAPPNVAVESATDDAIWDVALWDNARWDDGASVQDTPIYLTGWQSQGAAGVMLAPRVQFTINSPRRPDAEFLRMDVLYSVGAPL